jgi:iron complex outermembrane receptor protein
MEKEMMRGLSIFAFILYASAIAFGQAGSITGHVTDSQGRAVHQASVQITELKRTTATDDDGAYEFKNVAPGTYTLAVRQEGFGSVSRPVSVSAGAAVTLDVELEVSGVNEQVTVTAAGTEQSTFEAIASVSNVGANEILSRASVGLGDVLDDEPGVSKRSSGAGASRPVIRGFDGDRVLVSNDGVRTGSLASQSGDHAEPVDPLAQERIEVVKGPATLLYGSNAIGGVVNAISGHDEGAHPGVRGYFSALGGTNNDQAALSGGLEYGYKNWMVWGNASGQRTGDYTAGGDFGKVENSFTRNAAGSLGGGYFAQKAFVNATYNYYQNRYGIPLDFRETDPEARSLRVWRNDTKANFGYNDANWAINSMKFTVDLSNYRHQEIADGEVGTTFHNKVFSYRGIFDQKKYGRLTGRFGFDGYRRDFQTLGEEMLVDGPVKQDSFAVFALEELKYERVTLQFGGRVETNRYGPQNASLPARDFTGFSAAAGARFSLWKDGALVANFSRSHRAPALEELYNNGPHDGSLSFEIGDPSLRAETSNGIDVALRHQSGRFKGEASVYYYSLSNYIFLAPTGGVDEESGFPIAEYRQGNSTFRGTELSGDLKLTSYLNLLAGFDYVRAELKSGTPLPRIAPLRGRLGLDAHYKNLTVKPEFVVVGDQDRVFVNETRTPGYGMFNVSASYLLPTQHFAHIFSVNAYNLIDRLAFNHVSFIKEISPEIGRGVRFGYTVRFF